MQRHNNSISKINILLATFACSGNLPAQDLIISEIWPGQEGTDVTADWFEIRNDGMAAWVSGIDANLYYDDDSSAPTNADIINGITNIQPGESVIVVVGDAVDATEFTSVWSPVIDLSATEVGWTDGSGLGGGGDAVTLWIGDPNLTGVSVEDFASYPDTSDDDAASYNILSSSFSSVGSNGAVSSIVVGGTTGDIPAVASPGDGSAIFESNLQITEIWPGPLLTLPMLTAVSITMIFRQTSTKL